MKAWTSAILRFWRLDLAGVAVLAAVAAGCYLLLIQPLLNSRELVKTQAVDLVQKRTQAARLKESVKNAQHQLAEIQKQLQQAHLRLEPAGQLNRRLAQLTDLAGESGVQVDSIESGRIESNPRYRTVSIRLAGRGDYRSCARFLHALSQTMSDTGAVRMELASQPMPADSPTTCSFDLLWHAAPEGVADVR